MNSTEILSKGELHDCILNGVIKVRETVTSTMGADGQNVIIEEQNGFCRVTKDGVSVAKSINLQNKFENMGARLLIDASISTVDEIGDGTTTTILLASTIYEKAIEQIKRGASHRKIIEQINKDKEKVLEELEKYKIDSLSLSDLIKCATTSANNDNEIGKIVGELWHKIGKNGMVNLSRSESGRTHSKIYDGLVIGTGYFSKLFTNSGNKSVLENCFVFSTNHDINSASDILPILEHVADSKIRKLFILAKSFSNDAAASLLANKKNGVFDVCISETPTYPDWNGIDEDLAIVTGGKFVDKNDISLSDIDYTCLGEAKSVVTTLNKISVIPHKKSEQIDDFVSVLRSDMDERRTETYKDRLKKRIARLEGKIAIIYVGGLTETEHEYLFDMFDDSVKSTKNCMISGITVGGGTVYMKLSNVLEETILKSCLERPIEKLLENSSYDKEFVEKIKHKIKTSSDFKFGFNLLSDSDDLENLYESGIVEPIGLIESCIKNGCSVANLLISTHSGISIVPESLI